MKETALYHYTNQKKKNCSNIESWFFFDWATFILKKYLTNFPRMILGPEFQSKTTTEKHLMNGNSHIDKLCYI